MRAPASFRRDRIRRAVPASFRRDRTRRAVPAVVFALFAAIACLAVVALMISANDGIEGRAQVGESTYAPPRGHKAPNPTHSVQVVTSGDEIATSFSVGRNRVVTVAHAVVPGDAIVVNGRRARVVRVDRRSDLAVLAVPALGSARPRLLVTDSALSGVRLRLLRFRDGRASSLSVDVRRAIVAHVRTAGDGRALTRPALELAAHVSPGDSGAPLVTDSGALAGVIFASSRDRDGIAYAVDASAVRRLLGRG